VKLSAVRVRNFRSLQDTGIDNIDDFNVLIGKNNSGKSNFLSAINAFFQILSNESLVSSRPIIGNSADFSKSHPNVPISICARFLPSEHEISQLLTAMREERPQIRTALDALPHELSLSIELRILPPPSGYSFVKVVALADLSNDQKSWTLLKIGRESSYALYRNYQEDQAARLYQQSITRAISRIDEDDWRRLREARASENFMYRSLFDPGFADPFPRT
jgi:putative ATP-dependent endonuclease of the OLD family